MRAYHFLEQCVYTSISLRNYCFQQQTKGSSFRGEGFVSVIKHWKRSTIYCKVCNESHVSTTEQQPTCLESGIPTDDESLSVLVPFMICTTRAFLLAKHAGWNSSTFYFVN
jgi:hypothetical protein